MREPLGDGSSGRDFKAPELQMLDGMRFSLLDWETVLSCVTSADLQLDPSFKEVPGRFLQPKLWGVRG